MKNRSNALALAAIVVAALGASPLGHAAGRLILPKASVGAAQLKANAVTGLKVRNGSLTSADFKPGQLPVGPRGPKGDTGATGAQGAQGPKGDPGLPGMSGYRIVLGPAVTLAPGAAVPTAADCPAGESPVGWGYHGTTDISPLQSWPSDSPRAWVMVLKNVGASTGVVQAVAVCVNVG